VRQISQLHRPQIEQPGFQPARPARWPQSLSGAGRTEKNTFVHDRAHHVIFFALKRERRDDRPRALIKIGQRGVELRAQFINRQALPPGMSCACRKEILPSGPMGTSFLAVSATSKRDRFNTSPGPSVKRSMPGRAMRDPGY